MQKNQIKMTKEPDKSNWQANYNNKLLSGIEVKDKNGDLVNFITIRHDEVLENGAVHRITIRLDENAKPLLPPPQTFEEIIQAKRRQQMLLYGSGQTSSAILSSRNARRVAAAARQTASAAAAANLTRRNVPSIPARRRPSSNRNRNRNRSKSRSRKKPIQPVPETPPKVEPTSAAVAANAEPPPTPSPPKAVAHPQTPIAQSKKTISEPEPMQFAEEPTPSTSGRVVTSIKDLEKNHLFKTADFDPKEVKMLLKSAAPGSSIVLPNGTVIKKSRRGGARAGAGRKRSRPLPLSQLTSSTSRNSNASQPPISSNSSFSSQA